MLYRLQQQSLVKALGVDAFVTCECGSNAVSSVEAPVDEFAQRVVGFGARSSVECPSTKDDLLPQLPSASLGDFLDAFLFVSCQYRDAA